MIVNYSLVCTVLVCALFVQSDRVTFFHEVHVFLVPVLKGFIQYVQHLVLSFDALLPKVSLHILSDKFDFLLILEFVHEHVEHDTHDTDQQNQQQRGA